MRSTQRLLLPLLELVVTELMDVFAVRKQDESGGGTVVSAPSCGPFCLARGRISMVEQTTLYDAYYPLSTEQISTSRITLLLS